MDISSIITENLNGLRNGRNLNMYCNIGEGTLKQQLKVLSCLTNELF